MPTPDTPTCARCGESIDPGAHFCARCGADVSGQQGHLATSLVPPAAVATQQRASLELLRRVTLGDYEILAELGRGGMATVYLAHDIALDRKVAIKVMSPALFMGEGMVERFKREARTAASLSHPHIIPIYAVKQSEQLLYFVMKFVEGRPLDSIIREIGPLPIPMAQGILNQVGSALGYAHRRGIIHRDIKPPNIMVDTDGWAVVTDFGIAKVAETHGLTMTGATVGTPSYMSPEQCGAKELTGASDQYSLGVVGYEMLAGRLPFVADSVMAIMYAHFNEPPPPVTGIRQDCPPELAAALMRMLEKEPEKRWPNMEAAVAAIGGTPLAHDDPIRTRLVTLVASGATSQLLKRLSTPASPMPFGKSQQRAATGAAGGVASLRVTPAPGPSRRVVKVLGGLAVVAAGVLVWRLHPWTGRPAAFSPSASVKSDSGAPVQPAQRAAAETLAPAPPLPRLAATPRAEPPGPRGKRPGRESPPGAAASRNDSVLRSVRADAQAARERALVAGASAADLAAGDAEARAAESLSTEGRLPRALARLGAASALWAAAERNALARIKADTARPRAQAAHPAAAAPQPADPRAEIAAAIAAYARAIESADIAAVRRAYPGLSSKQEQGLSDFFRLARNIKADLRVGQLDRSGDTAEAAVEGTFEYENTSSHRIERQPVTFRATVERGSGGWRLTAIH